MGKYIDGFVVFLSNSVQREIARIAPNFAEYVFYPTDFKRIEIY
jgi:hypothetical protein